MWGTCRNERKAKNRRENKGGSGIDVVFVSVCEYVCGWVGVCVYGKGLPQILVSSRLSVPMAWFGLRQC